MASSGTRVFVLGGESFGAPKAEDINVIHVLDTSALTHPLALPTSHHQPTEHIKYPESGRPPGGAPGSSSGGDVRRVRVSSLQL